MPHDLPPLRERASQRFCPPGMPTHQRDDVEALIVAERRGQLGSIVAFIGHANLPGDRSQRVLWRPEAAYRHDDDPWAELFDDPETGPA